MAKTTDLTIELRNLDFEDFLELKEAMMKSYDGMSDSYWDENSVKRLLEIFPEGQLCIAVNNKVVAGALSIIVNYKKLGDNHTYDQVVSNGTFDVHDSDGDVLYGIDIFVAPGYRGLRLGRRMYDARKELCENLNLHSIVAGGRIPNYSKYADDMTPRQYIEKVKQKEIYDPTLTFQLSNDFHVKKILKNYLRGDKDSLEYATLLEWLNIYYQEEEKLINAPRITVRIGLAQWQMRLFHNFDALIDQAEYFIDVISDYQSDFILFPEYFNAPLLRGMNDLEEAVAMRELAKFSEPIRQKMLEFAVSYNVNIISGSMPFIKDNKLLNISYLCRRDGTWDYTYKLHPTPYEANRWGMVGGKRLKVFDTDCGKIGILICYDVEFPETARILAQQGMQILFVPFQTDTQYGYNRVRHCAQARAIENECYVAMAGSVGNLPRVINMDINFAQSAIFTPSDFPFPSNAIAAEATPNAEMTVIGDVNLESLKELHSYGSVQNLRDMRSDLYEVVWKGGKRGRS